MLKRIFRRDFARTGESSFSGRSYTAIHSWLREHFFQPRNPLELFGAFYCFVHFLAGSNLQPVSLVYLGLACALPVLFPLLLPVAIGQIYSSLPLLGMHSVFMFVLGPYILANYAFLALARKSNPGEECWAWIAGPIRRSLLVLYFFTAFTKFNSGFFDPSSSCVSECYLLFGKVLWGHAITALSPAAAYLGALGVVVFEVSLIVGLASSRSRNYAILAGVFFHLGLGLMGHYRLSVVMTMMYLAFLPSDLVREVARSRVTKASIAAGLALDVLIHIFGKDDLENHLRDRSVTHWATLAAVLLFYSPIWVLLFRKLFANAKYGNTEGCLPGRTGSRSAMYSLASAFVPLSFVVLGLAPFLGLCTANTFSSMYSNLRVEGGRSNHFLVPAGALEIFPFLRDLVDVEQIQIRPNIFPAYTGRRRIALQGLARMKNIRIPRFELERWALSLRDAGFQEGFQISYSYGNEHYRTELMQDPLFLARERSFLDKFLAFRAFHENNDACSPGEPSFPPKQSPAN